MFFEQSYSLVTDQTDRWESYQVFLAPLNWRFESGDRIEANVIPQGERLSRTFLEPTASSCSRGAITSWYRLEVELAARRRLASQIHLAVRGVLQRAPAPAGGGGFWRPTSSLIFELEGEHDIGRLPEETSSKRCSGSRRW
jgi:hypothetical protein